MPLEMHEALGIVFKTTSQRMHEHEALDAGSDYVA